MVATPDFVLAGTIAICIVILLNLIERMDEDTSLPIVLGAHAKKYVRLGVSSYSADVTST